MFYFLWNSCWHHVDPLRVPKKDKRDVHVCNPTLSVLVVLLSLQVNCLRSISLAVILVCQTLYPPPRLVRNVLRSCLG